MYDTATGASHLGFHKSKPAKPNASPRSELYQKC